MPVARMIIASGSENSRQQLSGLLASAGFEVFRVCASGGEVRRALAHGWDGVLLIAGALPDETVDALAWDVLSEAVRLLFIAREQQLNDCEHPEVFRLELPCSGQAVLGAVRMLAQLHDHALPKRGQEDEALVQRAKALLMQKRGISEQEAYQRMQRYAMNHGIKMRDCAERLVRQYGQEA